MEQMKDFRKDFRDKYYTYYRQSQPVKIPKLYMLCSGGALILAVGGLFLQLLYVVNIFQGKYLFYVETAMYLIALFFMAIGDSKYSFRKYKREEVLIIYMIKYVRNINII